MPFIDDLPPKRAIVEHWKERLFELGFFSDWGEPSCWACGFHYDAKYDIQHPDASWEEVLRCWDRIPLQRCHIVPRQLGGSNDPANLFLMCRECHDLAPDTNIPGIFFEWARGQSSLRREIAKYDAAFEAFGVKNMDSQQTLSKLIVSKEFRSWMRDKSGLHRPQSNYAPRSSRLKPATIVGLAIHYQRGSAKGSDQRSA